MAHLYATFSDAALAEKAAGALLDYGVRKEDLTVVAHETHDARSRTDALDTDNDTTNGRATERDRTDLAAKQGISTTTPEDAGAGAVKGTEIGLGIGILAGLASLLVPGVGLVLGGGALATAIGGAALTAGAGAVAGGVTGYLKEQGVPGEAVQHYQSAVDNGGAVLSLNIPSGDVDQTAAEQVLSKYAASNVNAY